MLGAQCLHEHVLLPWGKYLKICAQTALIAGLQWETCTYLDVEICNILGQSVWFGATNSWINVQELPKSGETCTWQNQKLDETKKKSCRTKTSQVIAMYRRFYFACGQGVTKNLDRCQIVAADLRFESDLFLQPKTVIVATQKMDPWVGFWVMALYVQTPSEVRCFRYVLEVQIHSQSQEVFGCLGCYPKWFYPSFFW